MAGYQFLLLRFLLSEESGGEEHKQAEQQHDDSRNQVNVITERLLIEGGVAICYKSQDGKDQPEEAEH